MKPEEIYSNYFRHPHVISLDQKVTHTHSHPHFLLSYCLAVLQTHDKNIQFAAASDRSTDVTTEILLLSISIPTLLAF